MSKKLYPKELILNTAIELAKKNGFEKLSIRAIARELNTSVSPVYDSFESKEDIIYAVVIEIINEDTVQESYFERNKRILEYGLNFQVLYRDIQHYTRNNHIKSTHYDQILNLMRNEPKLKDFNESALGSLNFDTLIYISGLVHLSESDKNIKNNHEFYQTTLSQVTELMILGYKQALKEEGQ